MAFPFANLKEGQMQNLDFTVADAFDILGKLPKDSKLDLVYGVPEFLNRRKISPAEAIRILTPVFRGKMPEQKVKVGYTGFGLMDGALHRIYLTLNPESFILGKPVFSKDKPYNSVTIYYEESLN